MKLKHIALIGSLFPILFSLVLFFGVLISADSDDENSNFSSGITGMNLSAEVLKHQPMVEKYARENGISEYVNVLLAIIQVESGGTAEDVMQSSESLGLPPNSLDTESSIKQGCKYFASLLSSCQNQGIDDLNVAIQSYNYGGGYVGYVAGKGKKHTFNLAENFAREKSGGKKVTYTNPIAVAKNGGWRYGYGNMFYVELVNQYLTVSQVSGELAQKVMNEALKYQDRLSAVASNYYLGLHILSGCLHGTSVSAKREYQRGLHTNQHYRWNGKIPSPQPLPAKVEDVG